KALMEIFALEHLRNRVLCTQPNEILSTELREPAAVEIDHRFFCAKNFENLRLVGLGILLDLLAGERRARGRAAGRVAYHAGEITDQKDDRVAEILKMFEFAQQDGVAEVQIGSGRIESRLHAQRLARFERAFKFR